MLLPSILPSPNQAPAEAVAWYLTNPLLVAAYPEGIARRKQQLAEGVFAGKDLHKLAIDLYCERNRLHLNTRVEPQDPNAYDELRELLQSPHISRGEGKDLGFRIRTARPSEYPWLRARIEAAIQQRAQEAERRILQAA
jgi:hypothetical protein